MTVQQDLFWLCQILRHFKCIISPENQNIDLRTLTKCFVRKMEKLTGYEFYWMEVIHTDTEHNWDFCSITICCSSCL